MQFFFSCLAQMFSANYLTVLLTAGTGMTDQAILEQSALKRAEEKVYTDLADIYLKNMRCKEVSYLSTDTVQDVINKVRL